ncbi:2Fe-2S iron-sulfur cluster binding domain-containing protein (plasmid) [Skermanella sp. TT6]|uniref:2Fe-2S iron-sulfur cluster binding domain-containing protein n=1 Tax=Skermanella cutis TaxID=2775420 RepID=A0ABX7BEF8_9PROT|nr:2Fe-2S iron-sulfur cluster-binding protein [Skermanella sp. TT6]QQP92800.1 2Fe-2S iron-sulfur cluster binding domain-containing protein [Skermanella sp. TT6]
MNAVTLRVNDRTVSAEVEPRTHLADFLREDQLLTGTHVGCEHGVCGACTLMVDGRPVRSCLTFAASCADAEVRTIESFDEDPLMGRLRDAFSRRHALQCGFCTPGMLVTAYDIVRRLPDADEDRIREELAGNLCRCTGYAGIVEAIRDVLADPVPAPVQPISRTGPAPRTVAAGRTRTAPPQAPDPASQPLDASGAIKDGVTLGRSIPFDLPPDRLWELVKRIDAVVACLPGAKLAGPPEENVLDGTFTVAIGPIRTAFAGKAAVGFDEAARSGTVRGRGGDTRSRSSADGAMDFRVLPDDNGGSRVEVELTYRLKGPLAQFGRPAIVSGVIDRLLSDFAANFSALARGEPAAAAGPASGIGLVLGALLARLRKTIGW